MSVFGKFVVHLAIWCQSDEGIMGVYLAFIPLHLCGELAAVCNAINVLILLFEEALSIREFCVCRLKQLQFKSFWEILYHCT